MIQTGELQPVSNNDRRPERHGTAKAIRLGARAVAGVKRQVVFAQGDVVQHSMRYGSSAVALPMR